MADGRRASNPPPQHQQHQANQIPQAPPLPARSSALARFAAQLPSLNAARPQSLNAGRADGTRSKVVPSLAAVSGISALSSQDATHKTGLDISALDINHDRTQAILAGREILKTVSVHGTRCSEAANLRSAILNYASHNTRAAPAARQRDTLDIHDVKWSHGAYKSFIATAATNGKIVLYDLTKAGIEVSRLHEHHRQVHKLAFNPHQPSSLLSASQDGTVRLWDLRDLSRHREAIVCRSRQAYPGQSEGVRDVRWSPSNGEVFAFCTDNGVIQKWETRNAKGPLLRINAHDKLCHAIDWHPDGKHVLSASADRTVKVWDFSSDQRRQKAARTLRTPYPVSNVRWRPPCRPSGPGDRDNEPWQCTQFATTFEKHSQVLLWDFRRPYVPFREVVRGTAPPSDMLWHSQHLLWTVGREGIFAQSDVYHAPKVLDRRNMQAFAMSPSGEIAVFSQKRPRRRDTLFEHPSYPAMPGDSRGGRHSVADPASAVSLMRGSADDSLDDAFLSSSYKKHHGRTLSNRSTRSFGSTPPSNDEVPIKDLEESLKQPQDSQRPNQVAFRGSIDSSANPSTFAYLAQKYKHYPHKEPRTVDGFKEAYKLFEVNAEYAQRVSFYRIAQSFRIVGSSIQYQLQRRAELLRLRRLGLEQSTPPRKVFRASQSHGKMETKSINGSALTLQSNQTLTSPLRSMLESTSAMATPLAQPRGSDQSASSQTSIPSLSDLDNEASMVLPPPIAGPGSISPTTYRSPEEPRRSQLHRPEFNGPHWYNSAGDLTERRAMLSNYRHSPKMPLNLEPPGITSPPSKPINIPPPLDRHNSDESFAMFSTSTDSRAMSVPGSQASSRSLSKRMESVPEAREKLASGAGPSEWNGSSVGASSDALVIESPGPSQWSETSSLGQFSSSVGSPVKAATQVEDRVRFQEPVDLKSPNLQARHASSTIASEDSRSPLVKTESLSFSTTFDSSFSGPGSQPSRGTWSTSNTSSSGPGNLDASGTIVPDDPLPDATSLAVRSLSNGTHVYTADSFEQPANSQGEMLSDYTSKDALEDELGLTFPMIDLVTAMLEYHTDILSDAQTSAQLLLLLAPLLPQTSSVKQDVSQRTFAVYSDLMSALGLTQETVQRDTSRSLERMLDSGLHPLQAESILSAYHDQLLSLDLLNAAVNLRRLCFPMFPAVYEQSIKATGIGLLCEGCKNPLNNPKGKLRCENCSKRQAPCPICWCDAPAIDYPAPKAKTTKRKKSRLRASSLRASAITSSNTDPDLINPSDPERSTRKADTDLTAASRGSTTTTHPAVLWLTCPLCNHSAHLSCFSAWLTTAFAPGDLALGACPSPGCTCDCAPGALRDERVQRIEQRVAQRDRERGREGRAVRDEWRAAESRAVSQVRGMVDAAAAASAAGGGTAVLQGEARQDRRVRLREPEEYAARSAPRTRRIRGTGN